MKNEMNLKDACDPNRPEALAIAKVPLLGWLLGFNLIITAFTAPTIHPGLFFTILGTGFALMALGLAGTRRLGTILKRREQPEARASQTASNAATGASK